MERNYFWVISDKWILSTVSGTNIEFEDIIQTPLTQRKRDSDIFRQEIENLLKRSAVVPVPDNERGYISIIFLRDKKDNK